MKQVILFLFGVGFAIAATADVDLYSAKELTAMGQKLAQKRTQFASQDLSRYGNHYTMLAFRDATGSSEVHEREADIFVVESGEATLVSGGQVVDPHQTKAGEIRGSSIKGGERHPIGPGDVIHIPAGTPHQLLVDKDKPFTYFVIKVTGQ